MNKEFVAYQESLELKELGFDEPCFGYWNIDPSLPTKYLNPRCEPFKHEWCLPAPTFSQAFRWFRENHSIVFWYEPILKKDYTYNFFIYNEVTGEKIFVTQSRYCKEAELACLRKLIEIVKQK